MTTLTLPYPVLVEGRSVSVPFYTDQELFNTTGVRIAFTTRRGGVSNSPFDTLNVGAHVCDNTGAVEENRRRIMHELGADTYPCIVPKQVHGDSLICIDANDDVAVCMQRAQEGVDGILVDTSGVAAMLAFADCVPVILVGPDASFAVVHAGWRGVDARIATKALQCLARRALFGNDCLIAQYCANTNVYIGPYIHAECFEVSPELATRFSDAFGANCLYDECHVDLGYALRSQLIQAGVFPRRIADINYCTVCNHEKFFSYRAGKGQTGRHAAVALRVEKASMSKQ